MAPQRARKVDASATDRPIAAAPEVVEVRLPPPTPDEEREQGQILAAWMREQRKAG